MPQRRQDIALTKIAAVPGHSIGTTVGKVQSGRVTASLSVVAVCLTGDPSVPFYYLFLGLYHLAQIKDFKQHRANFCGSDAPGNS
jgi:hypothetical protein